MSGIDKVIQKLRKLQDDLPKEAQDILKAEIPVGRTGALRRSARLVHEGPDKWALVVGGTPGTTDEKGEDYTKYVLYGRGEITPKNKKSLMYIDYTGSQTSHHNWGDDGFFVYGKRFGPSVGNPFMERAARKIHEYARSILNE